METEFLDMFFKDFKQDIDFVIEKAASAFEEAGLQSANMFYFNWSKT